ncbi:phage tail domain-containing protein [Planococcus versutus]|uniref:Siphovirus-type tail component RIFT-related domain-containing protein n=1 Tax=Planococcus versutus TaxID=1302659 RepID=A0A1B1S5K7_9BACL|nr:phage tail domain-containing protein [Planococcus versutus]ANU28461.1 hypothetical protein I858_015840 [Planococcus versutus]
MDVLIEKLDGQTKRFSDLGLIPRDFRVSSIGLREYGSQVTGRSGRIDKGADYDVKNIAVPFMFESEDLASYGEKRDEIFAWLGGKEAFYIYEGRSEVEAQFELPGESNDTWDYQSDIDFSKRYLVRRTNEMSPNQQGLWGLDEITFSTIKLPFGESAMIHKKKSDVPIDFIVTNNGTETIDPVEGMHLYIYYIGPSTNLKIKNLTNGTIWSFTGSSASGNVIEIDGVQSKLKGLSIVRNTNLGLITLSPGQNRIKVEGATFGQIAFEFREYFR